MGLTIHYTLQTKLTKVEDVRALVHALRQHALDLPFKEVNELVEFSGKDIAHDDQDDPDRWLKIQAGEYVDDPRHSYPVSPLHIIAFTTFPGDGSEPANFGLCKYPASIVVPGTTRRMRTKMGGWRWQSFCKTQYASDPEYGGVPNFLRCHLCVVKLLDFVKKTDLIEVEVKDEGGYWDQRDLQKLANVAGDWNQMIAAFAGQLKDAAQAEGMSIESAIAGFPNFEHLEAKGLEQLKKLNIRRISD
jgi:hypothetical protein